MRRLIALLPAMLLAACAAPPPAMPPPPPLPLQPPFPMGVHLTVEPRSAPAGGTVTLLLRNGTSHSIGFNLCMSALEQRRGDAWVRVPESGVCTRQLNVIGPGREARHAKRLPAGLPAGDYRYRTNIEAPLGSSPQRPHVSASFRVG